MDNLESSLDRRLSTVVLIMVVMLITAASLVAAIAFNYQRWMAMRRDFSRPIPSTAVAWNNCIAIVRVNNQSLAAQKIEVQCIDPRTGQIRTAVSDIVSSSPRGVPITLVPDAKRLWVTSGTNVYLVDGESSATYTPKIKLPVKAHPFLLNGELTVILGESPNIWRVYSFEQGEWKPGHRIRFPKSYELMRDDATKFFRSDVPAGERGTSNRHSITVDAVNAIQIGSNVYLYMERFGLLPGCWRVGLDYVPEDNSPGSAADPVNVDVELPGWKFARKNDPSLSNNIANGTPIEHEGQLFLSSSLPRMRSREEPAALWRREPDDSGQFTLIRPTVPLNRPGQTVEESSFVSMPITGDLYRIDRTETGAIKLLRLVNGRLERVTASIPGREKPIVDAVFSLICSLLAVLVVSQVMLVAGAARLERQWNQGAYAFGQETVVLASVQRRWLARIVDATLWLCPLGLMLAWSILSIDPDQRLSLLSGGRVVNDWMVPLFIGSEAAGVESDLVTTMWILAGWLCVVVWMIAYVVESLAMQDLRGSTPGKWICGIRVIRTTLRPCGFARSLLRELLLAVDTVNLLLPVIGVASILLSEARQRVGDWVADTIVVERAARPREDRA